MPSKTTREQLARVAPNLYRHEGNGSYYGIRKVGNRKKTHSLHTTDRALANRRLTEWLKDCAAVDPGNRDGTLAQLLERFRASRAGRSRATIVAESGMMAEFAKSFPRPMETPVAKVRHSDLATWLTIIKPGQRHSTFNRWRLFLHQLFALAEADGMVGKSPFVSKLHPRAKKQKVLRLIPNEEEFRAIIAEIRHPKVEPNKGKHGGQRRLFQHESADFAEFLGLAGVGQAEAVGLRWEDITDKTIRFTRKKTGRDFTIPIYGWLRPLIDRLREGSTGGPVFKIRNVKHALASACQRLGYPHFTQRGLRAMRIKRMWEAGADVKLIAKLQGHSDGGKLILDTYTEVFGSNDASYEAAQIRKMEEASH